MILREDWAHSKYGQWAPGSFDQQQLYHWHNITAGSAHLWKCPGAWNQTTLDTQPKQRSSRQSSHAEIHCVSISPQSNTPPQSLCAGQHLIVGTWHSSPRRPHHLSSQIPKPERSKQESSKNCNSRELSIWTFSWRRSRSQSDSRQPCSKSILGVEQMSSQQCPDIYIEIGIKTGDFNCWFE